MTDSHQTKDPLTMTLDFWREQLLLAPLPRDLVGEIIRRVNWRFRHTSIERIDLGDEEEDFKIFTLLMEMFQVVRDRLDSPGAEELLAAAKARHDEKLSARIRMAMSNVRKSCTLGESAKNSELEMILLNYWTHTDCSMLSVPPLCYFTNTGLTMVLPFFLPGHHLAGFGGAAETYREN